MKKFLKTFLISWCFSTCSFLYAAEFSVDFTSPQKYVQSLGAIRAAMGDAMSLTNIPGNKILYQLRPDASNIVEGVTIEIIGVGRNNSPSNRDVRFVINPSDLYLTGFIVGRIFYRFSDFSDTASGRVQVNAPRHLVDFTIDMTVDSSYLSLARSAGVSADRTDLSIDRYSLMKGYRDLINHVSSTRTINGAEARALLSYATVLSEAVRFRSIQGNFASTALGDDAFTPYRLSLEDSNRTTRWDRLSDEIRKAHYGAIKIATHGAAPILLANVRDVFGMTTCTSKK
ncbi:ribosome-inactivating family protein [Paraburkholderia atlantica]|uniref:Ribosome-inactivating protein n=1 Tax=Paraburkholderia atlantica TaxID=2654982 RepID=D5WND3_PARAM|nr:ribosome-inactivating family protein [Paraburkholderia atlantica]ADG20812.1 ribosome-inactivating protein [Paraburkholderia atlantica]MBB5510737.1 shiga toxin subunit A [Paraburkholderia atlantica]